MYELVEGLSETQLDTPYRPGGWTIRQVVNHTADSHINAYGRFKRVITEDIPTINPYDQVKWAELPEAKTGDIVLSLELLKALHARWTSFLRDLQTEDFERTYEHPEHRGRQKLIFLLGLYAWHGDHHCAHIQKKVELEGWK